MKTRNILISIMSIVCCFNFGICQTLAQNIQYEGKVLQENKLGLSYANVIAVSSIDSSYIAGVVTDSLGAFVINAPADVLLKATRVGCKDAFIKPIVHSSNVIILEAYKNQLGEALISTTRPFTYIEGDALVTPIKGTILEKLGRAKDVLGMLPGVINTNGSIEVLGKGTPVFYINGRRVRNSKEIDFLNANQVKKVEVITTPGSRYDATTNAVIRLTVERAPGQGFSVDNTASIGYKDYLYGKDDLSVMYHNNKLELFASMDYSKNREKGSGLNKVETWNTSHYLQDIRVHNKVTEQLYEGKVGMTYSFSPKHSLGFYYQAGHAPVDAKNAYTTNAFVDGTLAEKVGVNQDEESKTRTHQVDGYYSLAWGKWTLDALFDFYHAKYDEDQWSEESPSILGQQMMTYSDKVKSRLLAGELHLARSLWKGKIKFGTEVTNSRRTELFVSQQGRLGNNDLLIKETNAAAYVELAQRFGKVTLMAGLRYEHIANSYCENAVKLDAPSRNYGKFFPSATLTAPIGKSMLQLNYSRKHKRPLYSQLSSTVSYVNSNLYQSGNPFLRNSYIDEVSANWIYKRFMLMAGYSRLSDAIISTSRNYEDNPSITLVTKDNSVNDLHRFQLIANYSPHFKKYYPSFMLGLVCQHYKVNYRGSSKLMNNPMAILRFNNVLMLPKDFALMANLSWQSKGDSENTHLGDKWQIDLSVVKQFGKHWQVKLSGNDLFNTAKTNTYCLYSDIQRIFMEKRLNTRSVELSVRFLFNTTKSRYKSAGAGTKEKARL